MGLVRSLIVWDIRDRQAYTAYIHRHIYSPLPERIKHEISTSLSFSYLSHPFYLRFSVSERIRAKRGSEIEEDRGQSSHCRFWFLFPMHWGRGRGVSFDLFGYCFDAIGPNCGSKDSEMESFWSHNAAPDSSHFLVAVYFAFGFFFARLFLDRFIFTVRFFFSFFFFCKCLIMLSVIFPLNFEFSLWNLGLVSPSIRLSSETMIVAKIGALYTIFRFIMQWVGGSNDWAIPNSCSWRERIRGEVSGHFGITGVE